jgi:DNA-binding beta-propeller fold protein YncE
MDYTTNTQIALITGFATPRGVALDVANNRYYVSGGASVRIMDYTTNTQIVSISADGSGIALDMPKNQYYLTNQTGNTVQIRTAKYR